jgi:hypothetical protein
MISESIRRVESYQEGELTKIKAVVQQNQEIHIATTTAMAKKLQIVRCMNTYMALANCSDRKSTRESYWKEI